MTDDALTDRLSFHALSLSRSFFVFSFSFLSSTHRKPTMYRSACGMTVLPYAMYVCTFLRFCLIYTISCRPCPFVSRGQYSSLSLYRSISAVDHLLLCPSRSLESRVADQTPVIAMLCISHKTYIAGSSAATA